MPKKKRNSRKARSVEVQNHELPGGFWRQVFAVLLMALAVVLVVSWFDQSGTFLHVVHSATTWLLGAGAYFLPVLIFYLAVKILRAEDNRLSPAVWIASLLMLVWLSGLMAALTISSTPPAGGLVGNWLTSLLVGAMEPILAIFIYLVLIFITIIFILQVSPLSVFQKTGELVKPSKKEDAQNAALATEAESGESRHFKLNSSTLANFRTKSSSKAAKSTAKAPASVPEKALVSTLDPTWQMPPTSLLEKKQSQENPGNVKQNAYIIESTLAEFGINVEMEDANIGPRVTQYTMRPPAGVNLSKILARDKELALNLAIDKVRIEAPIPGTRLVGIEIPNVKAADVRFRSILESSEWQQAASPLTFAVGKDISGRAVVANLGKMPHLLIAGTTGSGKSVMTNTLISSLLYRNAPSDLKLIIVDPKQVEMAQYEDIPHLLTPIITSVEKALSAMNWAVGEMERRYTLMAEKRVKKIEDYNKKVTSAAKSAPVPSTEDDKEKKSEEQPPAPETMPYIVIIIDEMADLMMMAGKDLEKLIVRIAQKGRAAGVHLVLATQRPEVKVITGLIKSNIPGRIAFAVGSSIDSRIMLDASGAEKLLGKGDMLMLTTEMMGKPRRIQGAFASDEDIAALTDFLRKQRPPEYNKEVISQQVAIKGVGPSAGGSIGDLGRRYDPNDPLVRRAVEISLKNGKFSTASLQTWLGKGHGFVSGLAIWFEEIGVVGPSNGNKPREVLISSMEEFDELANR